MVDGRHGKTGHVLGIHVGNRGGRTADPNRLALQHRNRKLTDHPLHEGHPPQDRVVQIRGHQPVFAAGLDIHQRHFAVLVRIQQGHKHQSLQLGALAGGEEILFAAPVDVIGTG